MGLHQSDSIILKTYPLGEADRIVSFFSRDHGKLRGVANGARKMKNRFGASLEPLAHSRIQFFEKENRDLVRIQSTDLLDSPMKLFEDYDRAVCSACSKQLQGEDARFLAPGLQSVICSDCDHRSATGILSEVVDLVYRILKSPLDGNDSSGGGAARALRNLHELNQYWIRHYSER